MTNTNTNKKIKKIRDDARERERVVGKMMMDGT